MAFNVRYGVSICGSLIDFEVRPLEDKHSREVSPCFILDVAVRNIERPLRGEELKIDLLDKKRRPLQKIFIQMDCGELPTMSWSGITSAHKAQMFAQTSGSPFYVVLSLHGHECVLPFITLPDPKKMEECCKDQKSCNEKDSEKKDENEEADEGEPKKEDEKKAQCCPDTFNTPMGPQPSVVRGNVALKRIFCRPWTVTATFNNAPPPCDCKCCEYRQYVRGEAGYELINIPGIGRIGFIDLSPAMDYFEVLLPSFPIPMAVRIIRRLGPAWGEDSIMVDGAPGRPIAYGHRAEMGNPQFDMVELQDYPDPCEYWGSDAPEATVGILAGIPRQFIGFTMTGLLKFHVAVEFRGEIIDTCRGNIVASGPRNWSWNRDEVV